MNRKLKNEELQRLSTQEFKATSKNKIVVILDNVRSLHNVGSVFRSADAFLIEELVLCGVTGTPPNKEIEKTALGATQTVKWSHAPDTLSAALAWREKKYLLVAVEQTEQAISLNHFDVQNQAVAVIFGNEVYGVSQEVVDACDAVIEIPQLGSKHSLNVSVSAGIVLWELVKQSL